MTTTEKCEAILRRVLEITNTEKTVSFAEDWGGNALTVYVGDSHTHVGDSDGTWEQLIDSLHGTLCEGCGLSWSGDPPPAPESAQ